MLLLIRINSFQADGSAVVYGWVKSHSQYKKQNQAAPFSI